jgi:hypothetical protein
LTQEDMPTFSWLSSQWIRQDLATATPGFDKLRQTLDHPMNRRSLPKHLSEKALRLWAEKEIFLTVLEGLPHTICHYDAFRRNLFTRSKEDGRNQTVAIDWALVGPGPVGAEIVDLVWVTLVFMGVEVSQARDLTGVVFEGYLDGLRDLGWKGDPRQVRFAFTAATALRRLGTLGYSVDFFIDENLYPALQQMSGHSVEEVADLFAEAGAFIEALADEARELLSILS